MFIPFVKVKYAVSEVCKLSETEQCVFALSCFAVNSFATVEGYSHKIPLASFFFLLTLFSV